MTLTASSRTPRALIALVLALLALTVAVANSSAAAAQDRKSVV